MKKSDYYKLYSIARCILTYLVNDWFSIEIVCLMCWGKNVVVKRISEKVLIVKLENSNYCFCVGFFDYGFLKSGNIILQAPYERNCKALCLVNKDNIKN